MTRKLLLAVALLALSAPARADTATPRMGVVQPTIGSLSWGPKINADFLIFDTSAAAQFVTNTFSSSNTFLGAVWLPTVTSSFTSQGAILAFSSVTGSTFFGDGSHLTGVIASSDVVSINGSLRGDGTAGAPLGVLSSSVAVLSGGFVLNSQIDPSSVTKQGLVLLSNLSGAVPSGRVDFSTITTALNAKYDASSTLWNSTAATIATGTNTINGAWTYQSSVTLRGAAAYLVTGSSATFGYITGYGAGITAIPAASISAGSLGATVIASSVASSGISIGTYGSSTQVGQCTFSADGRATSCSNVTISADAPGGVVTASSLTATGSSDFQAITATSGTFTGAGLSLAAGSTVTTSGGQLSFSTDTTPSGTGTHAFLMDNLGNIRINAGAEAIALSTVIVSAPLIAQSPFILARSSITGSGLRKDFYFMLTYTGNNPTLILGGSNPDGNLSVPIFETITGSGAFSNPSRMGNAGGSGGTNISDIRVSFSSGTSLLDLGDIQMALDSNAPISTGGVNGSNTYAIPTQWTFATTSPNSSSKSTKWIMDSTGSWKGGTPVVGNYGNGIFSIKSKAYASNQDGLLDLQDANNNEVFVVGAGTAAVVAQSTASNSGQGIASFQDNTNAHVFDVMNGFITATKPLTATSSITALGGVVLSSYSTPGYIPLIQNSSGRLGFGTATPGNQGQTAQQEFWDINGNAYSAIYVKNKPGTGNGQGFWFHAPNDAPNLHDYFFTMNTPRSGQGDFFEFFVSTGYGTSDGASAVLWNSPVYAINPTYGTRQFKVFGSSLVVNESGIVTVGSSVTVTGQVNNGYERIVNACGAGVTTCTATCSAGKVLTGGGCVSTVSLLGDSDAGTTNSWTCTSAIGTITSTVYCARLGP